MGLPTRGVVIQIRINVKPNSFWRDQFVILQIIYHSLDHIIDDLILGISA
jgi:hypothetical protein